MFFRKTIENKIRFKALLIYLLLAIGCSLMLVYMYHLSRTMDEQKRRVATHYHTLELTTKVISEVNKAQTAASRQPGRNRAFKMQVDSVAVLIDSLNRIGDNHPKAQVTSEIITLLKEKRGIVGRLHALFNRSNPVDPLRDKLLIAQPVLEKDSAQITTVIQDTVIRQMPRRRFWRRFADLFVAPPTSPDTIIQLTTLKADTILEAQEDKKAILTEVNYFTENAQISYEHRMQDIERQVESLLHADRIISERISGLLISLYEESVNSTLHEIGESEARIRSYYRYLIAGGTGMLVLVLFFLILMLQDVNQGRSMRRELQKAHDRVRQLMESRHRLLLSVSHDIKTPLNSILGYLELGTRQKSVQLTEIESMQRSGAHILGLLENLLEYAALEQGRLVLNAQSFTLKSLFEEVRDMFEPLCTRKELQLSVVMDIPNNVKVNSDPLKMKQILINLLSNAVKYTPQGTVALEVRYAEGSLWVKVSDTGAGIPKDKMDALFLPFERISDNNGLAEGSGLGLFVVKGLIELFGGTLDIASEVGRGSCFTLSIPLSECKESDKSEPKHLLVIDDDLTLLKLTGNMLGQLGHRVTVCSQLSEFDNVLKEAGEDIDMVLTDMEMDSFTGKDILSITKERFPNKPVVIMTARSDFHTTRAQAMGFDGFLVKPFNMESLYAQFGGTRIPTYDLSMLSELFEEDNEAIKEVIDSFVEATETHVSLLREASDGNDFDKAQALCHKMLPMFAQLQAADAVDLLRFVDTRKYQPYMGWEADIDEIISCAQRLTEHLKKRNLIV